MKVSNGDFIELDYVAKIKEGNIIFDLTEKEEAKKVNLYNPNLDYRPIQLCVGERHVVKGLDRALVGKEIGKEYTIEIQPEEGFGKKDAKLIQLVSTSVFKKQNIKPFPGLQVQIDNLIGIIKTVTGGRTLVDFNHPLAGKTLEYKIKIVRIIKDDKSKVKALLKILFRKDMAFELNNSTLNIEEDLPKELHNPLEENIKRLIKSVKKVEFNQEKKETKKA